MEFPDFTSEFDANRISCHEQSKNKNSVLECFKLLNNLKHEVLLLWLLPSYVLLRKIEIATQN